MSHPNHLPFALLQYSAIDFECPHCGVHSQHTMLSKENLHYDAMKVRMPNPPSPPTPLVFPVEGVFLRSQFVHVLVKCVPCRRITYFLLEHSTEAVPPSTPPLAFPFPRIVHQYPIGASLGHKAVPEGITTASIEAEKCLSVGAFNACGVMIRRAMHVLCEEKSAIGNDLYAQLKDLKEKQRITPTLWEWSEELRVLGRNGAHPEWPEVSEEVAVYGLKFLREIVRYVYINPYEVSQRRLKETSKKP